MSQTPDRRPTRRILFQGLGALGVAVALAGCGEENVGAADGAAAGSAGADGGATTSAPAAKAGSTLVATSDVPVNGGVILSDQKVVVVQPSEGEFKAFSAVCTHQGNIVTSVEDDKILCAYHGSSYSADTGDVEGGPAPAPLGEVAIKVVGTDVVLA